MTPARCDAHDAAQDEALLRVVPLTPEEAADLLAGDEASWQAFYAEAQAFAGETRDAAHVPLSRLDGVTVYDVAGPLEWCPGVATVAGNAHVALVEALEGFLGGGQ